jgi:hypothetical protein
MLLAMLFLAGCQGQTHQVRLRPVTANLDVLVHDHPGWAGVAQYDQMLQHLQIAVARASVGLRSSVPPLRLSALTGLSLPGGSFALPATTLEQQRRMLVRLQQGQMERLSARRAQARALQILAQTRIWRREARQNYDQAVAAANAQFGSFYGDAFAADSALRLNLAIQIKALEKTVGNWALSTPPTPRLNHQQQVLTAKRKQLASLNAQQTGAIAALMQQREAALTAASAARVAFVEQQRVQTAARLLAQDQAALAAQRALLSRETEALLARERRLVAAAIPGADTLGPMALPSGPTSAAFPAASLHAAVITLQKQRSRWVHGLYAETRASAEDVAAQHGWKLTFARPSPGKQDQTAQIAALLGKRFGK